MRKHYTPVFKAHLVQELPREEKTVIWLAAEHGIHPNQLSTWKRTAMEGQCLTSLSSSIALW